MELLINRLLLGAHALSSSFINNKCIYTVQLIRKFNSLILFSYAPMLNIQLFEDT